MFSFPGEQCETRIISTNIFFLAALDLEFWAGMTKAPPFIYSRWLQLNICMTLVILSHILSQFDTDTLFKT